MKDEPRKQSGGGLSLKTLLIAGAASATAAFVVPRFWEPGTVFAAAVTPIIVAIVQELIRRPVDTVSSVTARRTTGGAVILEPPPEEPFDPLAPVSAEELEALPETRTQRAVHKRRRLTPRQWKLALLTGVIAFVGAVGVVTASELLAGETVGGGDNPTTFFNGSRRSNDRNKDAKATPSPTATATPDEREATPTPTPTATATPTPTATPAPTETPQTAVPAPQSEPPASPTPAP